MQPTTSTCVLVLANGAPAGGTRIWGHVLVLANGQRLARIQLRQPDLSIREMQATMFWKQYFGAWRCARARKRRRGGAGILRCARHRMCSCSQRKSRKTQMCSRWPTRWPRHVDSFSCVILRQGSSKLPGGSLIVLGSPPLQPAPSPAPHHHFTFPHFTVTGSTRPGSPSPPALSLNPC